ncbi:hypothetical protein [Roseibacillus ishigakijimensis]|uniref:hypothetical protein n=1 Tax=Roseibacillus ishigakijimensis TaxID=454146 RepID=UPI00190833C1|nr:hypothetical protein [Roseibacillus ishigakijimensis]
MTGLLFVVGLYWVLSAAGAVDLDSFDFDLDADTEGDSASAGGDGFLGFLLRFVNAQDVPLMIVLSLLILFMWALSIFANASLNPGESGLVAVGLLLPNFILSALLVKGVTQPLRPFLRSLKYDDEHQEPLIGLSGTVKSRVLDADFGQVEVPRGQGAPALLNAILPEGRDSLVRGDRILVYDYDPERDKYLVRAFEEGDLS